MESTMELKPTEQVTLCWMIRAEEPIYSPRGYASSIHKDYVKNVEYDVRDNVMNGWLNHKILFRSLDTWRDKRIKLRERRAKANDVGK